tara:strand:- start:489 stop:653 length:165 start_codon:yes stop_codon:yes gene_type:complete
MKDLSKKIREGGVQKFDGSQLGISKSGKGSFPRFSYQSDEEYKENFNKIFKKKK